MIDFLRNAVFLWTFGLSIVSGVLIYVDDLAPLVSDHVRDLITAAILLSLWTITHFVLSYKVSKVEKNIHSVLHQMRVSMVQSNVNYFYRTRFDCESLTEDDAKYLYSLEDEMESLGVNSFTQRKVEFLKQKNIVP